MTSSPAQRAADCFAELPVEFRAAHPKPPRHDLAGIGAWLNGIHKGLEDTCQDYVSLTATALINGDCETASQLLINARPFKDAMAAFDELARDQRRARNARAETPSTDNRVMSDQVSQDTSGAR